MKYPKHINILHSDGKTTINAKVFFFEKEGFFCEYKFKDVGFKKAMTYRITLNEQQCVKFGLKECEHPSMNPMLGYENSIIGERCVICGKDFPSGYYPESLSSSHEIFKDSINN